MAVIDGSTSKTDYRHSFFHSNGYEATRIVARFIRHMPKDITCHSFLRQVTAAVRRHYSSRRMDHFASHPEDRLTCSAAVFSRLQREVWLVGDCQCLIDGTLYDNPKPAEARNAEKRARIARRMLDEGTATVESLLHDDMARTAIVPDIVASMAEQNISYAVIDGFHIPEEHVRVMTLDFQPHSIVLATDGYPVLLPTIAQCEAWLEQQRQTDPLNITSFKATKAFASGHNSFDDRTFASIRV